MWSKVIRGIIYLLLVLLIAAGAYSYLYLHTPIGNLIIDQFSTIPSTTTIYPQNLTTITQATTTVPTTIAGGNSSLYEYALGLINNDRAKFGLGPVTLSNEPSGQQHSESMLQNNYFSHWDQYGMKPYMRYTLLGGTQSVSENIAYKTSSYCTLLLCGGDLNPRSAIEGMEYSMMYNDSLCCNNGHRNNILDPSHNQVSIGIAYNSSTIYFTEDFLDSYILWNGNSPGFSNGAVYLSGTLSGGYSLSSVFVTYDRPVSNMSRAQLNSTFEYGYGQNIAGVVQNSNYYYSGLTTIVADQYTQAPGSFTVSFNMQNLISKNGAGEYTVLVWLNKTNTNMSFIGGSYTIFIGNDGKAFVPSSV
ncbi:MAG: CAP domain-containing protein [Candidatus Micrarchaeota archaeon]|nr:CAP domain-containing protein [Candidatus Micrarchaeota archaeon]